MIWKRQYSTKSSSDWGTFFQLKHAIHRTSVTNDPEHNMKATEDFLLVTLFAHIAAAAKISIESNDTGGDCNEIAKDIVAKYVKINLPSDLPSHELDDFSNDTVYGYAVDLMTMGLLWHGFHDAIKEADGNRILRYWKLLMIIFRQQGHYNYSKEAFHFIAQTILLSPRQAMDLKWSRTINTHGGAGHNIPCDLHMEHLNKRLKMMCNLGSNMTPGAVKRSAKALGTVSHICSRFEQECEIFTNKNYHTVPSFSNDLSKIQQQLERDKIFIVTNNRHHASFPTHQPLLQNLDWKKATEWVKEKIINYDV